MTENLKPCASCPWRKSSPATCELIPGFSLDLMRVLRTTVGQGDAFRPIMACHYSPEGAETHCRGYLARHGYTNLSVRFAAMYGRINLDGIDDACRELDLWPDFETMLAAYEEAQP